jgi:mono/diheme cytochrome c family protein/glucose/arabinose dehydrogenase
VPVAAVVLWIGLCWAAPASAAIPDAAAVDDQPDQPASGLVAEYRAADGTTRARVESAVNFVWRDRPSDGAPDPRTPNGAFSARWYGQLRVLAAGPYRFCVYAGGGDVELTVGGKRILQATTDAARWIAAEPIELEFGDVAIDVRFRKVGDAARLGLYWSGPQFVLEPLPKSALFHDPAKTPLDAGALEDGRTLVRGLRCAACHLVPGEARPLAAPSLAHLDGNIRPRWLSAWVGATPHAVPTKTAPPNGGNNRDSPNSESAANIFDVKFRMPGTGIPEDEAAAIVEFLKSSSAPGNGDPTERATSGAAPSMSAKDIRAGETLLHTIGCLACHRVGALGRHDVLGGGDLSEIATKRPVDFFSRWLEDPARINPAHRMPVFPLSARQRSQLAAYLSTLGKVDEQPTASATADGHLVERGRRLVGEYRCAACHQLAGDFSAAPARGAPDRALPTRTAQLSAKSDWDHACLDEPDSKARRPGYRLTKPQREAVRKYLLSLPAAAPAAKTPARALAEKAKPAIDGRQVLMDRNCLACHARGLTEGIAAQTPALIAAHPEWATLAPALAPPALTGVGDKLRDEALVAAIAARDDPRRPWLKIRMPRFELSQDESAALVRYFVDSDRIPDRPPALAPPAGTQTPFAALVVAGSRLVTSDGFGCSSCHQIGVAVPHQDNLAAQGTDLSLLGKRIRREWYDRWVRNPARIVPRMEMPSVVTPVRGVLDDNLDGQLAAVWRVLNEPGFTPPEASAVRVVRKRNMPNAAESAAVLTDVFHLGKRHFIRPLVIGLGNRHNVLVDFERNRLAAWWIGDTARQRTAGKSWFWTPGGTQLISATEGASELTLARAGRTEPPAIVGQFAAELDWWEHDAAGLRFGYRLRFAADDERAANQKSVGRSSMVLHVVQSIAPRYLAAETTTSKTPTASGFRRRFEIAGMPADARVQLRALPGDKASIDDGGRVAVLANVPGRPRVRIVSPVDARFDADDSAMVSLWARSSDRLSTKGQGDKGQDDRGQGDRVGDGLGVNEPVVCELDYLCDLPVDRFPALLPPEPSAPAARLSCVPGYEAVRLPLPTSEMPTGLAWRADGTLVFTSLKGQVWLAHDTNGDGLEDSQTPISDDLAAPYGVATHGAASGNGAAAHGGAAALDGAIDVINKNGLLRLYDRDGDGHAERTEVVASGWGHTDDYHDWAVGLARDENGGYTIALPCQQDQRSRAAAHLRGWAVRLAPRRPTADDPRRFLLEPIAGGLRFPMGLARSRSAALFVTDNQGNYTPFNELNHVVAGAHYGFINKLEQDDPQAPDRRPERRDAAIEIPHPWTRSVNGICFLDTPQEVRRRLGRGRFGPFEGHLLGCEYDTRRLVRMSLDRVGDTYQGAAYPFSAEPAAGEETFEGPVVCAVAPDGDVYVGNLRDSGWGAGRNTGSIVRLRPQPDLPAGIAEVRATPRGFGLEFTQPVDRQRASRADSYAIECYRRIATPEYGGADVDRQSVKVQAVEVAADCRRAELAVQPMRAGFVYELRLKNLARAGAVFHPAEAYYTLRVVPK